VNTTEPFVSGGGAALCQITFTTCFNLSRLLLRYSCMIFGGMGLYCFVGGRLLRGHCTSGTMIGLSI